MKRRAFLQATLAASSIAFATTCSITHSIAAPPRPVRLRWPWPVKAPDPHAQNDVVAALLGTTLYPPLYVRAIDGMLEPKSALGMPKEAKNGLRVDLAPSIRPSDVVTSISNARAGGARLALRDVPVPRVDGAHGVVFPGLADPEGLMRRLATPLAGIARVEPRRIAPTGAFDLVLEERDSSKVLRAVRRPLAPSVGVPAQVAAASKLLRFELEGAVDLGRSLRAFERDETDVAWLADGLFAPRPGARSIDLGPLAYLAIRAGSEAPELTRPGAVLSIVDSLAADRLGHLGFLRRGHASRPPQLAPVDPASVAPNIPILVRASHPLVVAAAEILARDLGGIARAVDDASFDRAVAENRYPLMLDVVRTIDDSPDGASMALATFDRATSAPPPGIGPRGVAGAGSAALAWEIALIGAQASHVWIPRAPFGGFDLEVAGQA